MNHNFPSAMTSPVQLDRSIPLVGYRFHPTDDELVNHFLKRKILGHDDDKPPFSEIKVCDFEPWDLPALVNTISEDQVWYFFCPREYKYLCSRRSNRTTRAGYWKPTGKPRKVKAKRSREETGTKRSLVFYVKDHPKPRRTKWIMHEYECIPNSSLAAQRNFLLCKLKSKLDENKSHRTPTSNEIATSSSCDENEHSIPLSFYVEKDNLTAMSTYEQGEPTCLSESEVTPDSGESRYYLDSEQETHNPNAMSTYEKVDFGFQNPVQTKDISEAKEGESSSVSGAAPSDKIDMSMSSIPADFAAGAFEVDYPEDFFNGLEAFIGLEDDFDVAFSTSSTNTDESLYYFNTRFDTSVNAQG